MHITFLCNRFLRRRRIAFLGSLAVALCVSLLIVITSLFTGFIRSYHRYWRGYYGDFIFKSAITMSYSDQLAALFESNDSVLNALPTISHGGVLYLGKGKVKAVHLEGVDFSRWQRHFSQTGTAGQSIYSVWPESVDFNSDVQLPPIVLERANTWFITRFGRPMTPSEQPIPVLLGIGILADPDPVTDRYDLGKLIAELRDMQAPLPIISGSSSGDKGNEAASFKRINRLCWPIGIVKTGTSDIDDNNMYLPYDVVAKMVAPAFYPLGHTGELRIICRPDADKDELQSQLFRCWKKFAAGTLNLDNEIIDGASIKRTEKDLFFLVFTREIRKQLYIMQVIVGFVCLVAALLVFVILMMIVIQKKRDIGIICALGSSRGAVAWLFILYGGVIGLLGSALGVILGVWATWKIETLESFVSRILGFKIWISDVYMFSEIPNHVDWFSLTWIVLTGVLTATLGALLPAWKAARLQPVETLRYE